MGTPSRMTAFLVFGCRVLNTLLKKGGNKTDIWGGMTPFKPKSFSMTIIDQKYFSWLTIGLISVTYGSFGWYIASSSRGWTPLIIAQARAWGWEGLLTGLGLAEEDVVVILLHVMALLAIFAITLGLMAPVTLVTIFFSSSFKSDVRSILSILLWSFAVVVMLRWFSYFARLLLLICAAILGKLELQDREYPQWQVLTVIAVTCLGSFVLGVLGYNSIDRLFYSSL